MFDIRVTLSATPELLAVLDRFAAALHTVSVLDKAARPPTPEPKSPPFEIREPAAATPVASPQEAPAKSDPASPSAEAQLAAALTVAEVRAAVAAAAAKDRAAVVALLQQHGAKSVSALAPEHYAAVLAGLKAIA
jgi:hypothetical protein